jgi:hypothetical protein
MLLVSDASWPRSINAMATCLSTTINTWHKICFNARYSKNHPCRPMRTLLTFKNAFRLAIVCRFLLVLVENKLAPKRRAIIRRRSIMKNQVRYYILDYTEGQNGISSKSRQSPGLFVIERFILPNQTQERHSVQCSIYRIFFVFACILSKGRNTRHSTT